MHFLCRKDSFISVWVSVTFVCKCNMTVVVNNKSLEKWTFCLLWPPDPADRAARLRDAPKVDGTPVHIGFVVVVMFTSCICFLSSSTKDKNRMTSRHSPWPRVGAGWDTSYGVGVRSTLFQSLLYINVYYTKSGKEFDSEIIILSLGWRHRMLRNYLPDALCFFRFFRFRFTCWTLYPVLVFIKTKAGLALIKLQFYETNIFTDR